MSHTPVMADLAVRLTQHHVLSARPDAPVVAPRRGVGSASAQRIRS